MEEFEEGDEEEAEEEADEEGDCYGFEESGGFDGTNGVDGRGGGFGLVLGGGLGGLVVEVGGGAVARGCFLAVSGGGEFGGVAVIVGLDCDGGGFSDGVVEGESYHLAEGVVDGFTAGLLRDRLAASATHCKQGKRRCEDSH